MVEIVITKKGWTVVWALKDSKKCEKNGKLFQSNDYWEIKIWKLSSKCIFWWLDFWIRAKVVNKTTNRSLKW